MTFQRFLGLLKGCFAMNELAPCKGQDDWKLVSSLGCEVAQLTLDSCACEVFDPKGWDHLLSWVVMA